MPELLAQGVRPGGCAFLKRDGTTLYYLVTKERYFDKPTIETLRTSLECMKGLMGDQRITDLAVPRIGCGLDGLSWTDVKQILREVFEGSGVRCTVYFQ